MRYLAKLVLHLGGPCGGLPVEDTIIRSLIESAILLSLVSVDLEYHDAWCA